ncbi:DNA gyrase subunit A [Phosphitispora fastidiosa]|uniref:DNA gyrase subunit A n=1 Tax=Phosphitispora fastidiosa TaxID=2837202 RepID=UPI001E5FBF73|nr:DNA gyrase subunit A [Phosphitispora fastidiosa]MBU7007559.1 DNA gyrase subunit A [Phosphitispora fastidiosa]
MTEQGAGKILPIDINDEMKNSYIDYAMSVIVGRALPDVRDGLKPVHRRILYAMHELGMNPDKPHKKSARIVGEVLGKYHPHGDSAVYDAMVRLAQNFSSRYPLIDGHGNFGSVDGDSAAAMRYTEARMSKIATELLKDIDKDTVEYMANFDDSLKEPVVLPARIPNLLINGSSGIAVGMATNIPPHNIGEVIDGVVAVIDNPDITPNELMMNIKGPDFPTGGIIMGREGINSAYATGRGVIRVRSQARIERMSNGKMRILVTELPYQVNKARLIEKIADLVRDKKLDGITDLRDESDRTGMQIVIELRRDANANVILNQLYKHTQMQETFGVIMLALVDGQPRILNLKEVLFYYLEHQKDVTTRRTRYELNKAEARAHIVEGLRIALNNLDAVIKTIRESRTADIARTALMERFGLSEKQAQAILEMRLQRLTGLERDKLEEEYKNLVEKITYLKAVLANEQMVLDIIKEELLEIRNKYIDERRTVITDDDTRIDDEDLIAEEDMVITVTHYGYIKRISLDTYRSQKRGGRGVTAMGTKEEDFVEHLFITTTHHFILFFTKKGKVYKLKVHEIPEAGRQAKGTAIVNLLQIAGDDTITSVIPVKSFATELFLFTATRKGIVKKTPIGEYISSRKDGLIALTLDDGDELIDVKLTSGDDDIIIGTANGMSIRFHETEVRSMGRTARGVRGITLTGRDLVVGMDLAQKGTHLLVVSANGYGKRTKLEEYRTQGRGGKGMMTIKRTKRNGPLVGIKILNVDEEIMMITAEGIIIRMDVKDISSMGRTTQGVTMMRLDEKDSVVALAKVVTKEED